MNKEEYYTRFIPDFFDRSLLQQYFSAGQLNKLFRVGDYLASTYIGKRKSENRPIKSMKIQALKGNTEFATVYRPLDVLLGAYVDNLNVSKPIEKVIQEQTSSAEIRMINLQTEVLHLEERAKSLKKEIAYMMGDFTDISPTLKQLKYKLLPKDIIVEKSTNYKNACGVYFLIKDKEIVYIGQSTNISARITQHTGKDFDGVSFILCDKSELDILETLYILAYQPKLNGEVKLGNTGQTKLSTPISLPNLINMFKKGD